MEWAKRNHTDEEIDSAGKLLISKQASVDDIVQAISVLNNWRASHAFPLNTMQMRLRVQAGQVDNSDPSVAQRIKRLSAIESKLRRLRHVTLSTMQDIAGCRAVVSDVAQARKLSNQYQTGRIRHEKERVVDYIENPSRDGYRSIHLVYRYQSERNKHYTGQRIEIQIRSKLQHVWATAVEAVDTFAGQQLKINQGAPDWTRFFALMGSHIAMREKTALVPNTPSSKSVLRDELRQLASDLNVRERLLMIGATARYVGGQTHKAFYYLIDLDIQKRQLRISEYTRRQSEEATQKLAKLEFAYRERPDKDVLLVSVESVKELNKMYPNYRADTTVFLQELARALR